MTKNTSPPDRIRGFTSIDDHEAAVQGRIVVTEHDGYPFRRIWHEGEWWHSVVDVVGALTESSDPGGYWRNTKKRLAEVEGAREAVTNCYGLKLPAVDGKLRVTDCATTANLFRIIQSIPSPRAEPIKRFLAEAGAERIDDQADPSRLVDRAIESYRKKGREDDWIDGRLQNISARNELTDEWKKRKVTGGKMAGLTQSMGKEMLGVTPSEHKEMKGLGRKDETRDHMDRLELAIVTLGEQAAKAFVTANDPDAKGNFSKTEASSMDGAKIAGDARRKIEDQTGKPVANKSNFLPKLDAEQPPKAIENAKENKA